MNKRVKKEFLKIIKILFLPVILLTFGLSILYELLNIVAEQAIFLIKKQFKDEEKK